MAESASQSKYPEWGFTAKAQGLPTLSANPGSRHPRRPNSERVPLAVVCGRWNATDVTWRRRGHDSNDQPDLARVELFQSSIVVWLPTQGCLQQLSAGSLSE